MFSIFNLTQSFLLSNAKECTLQWHFSRKEGGVVSRGKGTRLWVVREPMFEFQLFLWLRFALVQITQPL